MSKSNLPIFLLLLLCAFGCKFTSNLGGKTSNSAANSSPIAQPTIAGLDGFWEVRRGNNQTVLTFRENRFGLKEEEMPEIVGTFKMVSDDEVEIEVPNKPSKRITNIKVNGNSLTLTINGETQTARRIGS